MHLNHIKLAHFKNYENAEFTFCEKVNAIVGENGSGKTNLLDAIHYLSFCKSYFTPHDSLSIYFDSDFFAIHGEFIDPGNNDASTPVSCTFKANGGKVMKANLKEYHVLSDHIGIFPSIMISPSDTDLISEGSELRRKFIDMIISQFDKDYLRSLITYQKLINQRNVLLKQFIEQRHFNRDLLNVFDDQLLEPGYHIFTKRKEYTEQIIPFFQYYYDFLSGQKETVHISYDSGLLFQSFEEGLLLNETADAKSGYSHFGVHKDDFIFTLNDKPIKRFGSQGQQKSFTIALKLAQFDYIYSKKKIRPILLLDDIFDKLDIHRIDRLLELMGKEEIGQVFLSDTNEKRVIDILDKHRIEYKIFPITR